MFKFRFQKIMLFGGVFTLLFIIYQLSYGEQKQDRPNSKEFLMLKDIEKSLKNSKGNANSQKTMSLKYISPLDQDKVNAILSEGENTLPGQDTNPLFPGQKIVHIDLKGAPLKVSYYREFFPLIKSLGATGLIIEYEDMFPYTNKNIPASNMYSTNEIKLILDIARKNHLDVIPLVQTFGHLEFILKLKEFEYLREVPRFPQAICPNRNGTVQLLHKMIDDIISLHPNIQYLHIGCDEVYNLGECNLCVDVLLKKNWTKKQLFLDHVTSIARYIREKHPSVRPLIWDDELRKMSVQELQASPLGKLVEPVVWKYTPSIDSFLPVDIWDKYASVFGSVWIASAFKGATGPDKITTDISYHLENHRIWMRIVQANAERVVFKGIILTGWQRYDHFAVLCELLPVGLPSLAVNLVYLSQSNIELQNAPRVVLDRLKCSPGLMNVKMGARCTFPGSAVYEKAHQLSTLMDQIDQMLDMSQVKGWLTEFNVRTGFSNPAHVEGATAELDRLKMESMYLEQEMSQAMSEMFDKDTVREWILTYISPLQTKLQNLWDAKEKLLAKHTWPHRPLDLSEGEL